MTQQPDAETRKRLEIDLAWEVHACGSAEARLKQPTFREALRCRLAGEQNWRCCYCGRAMSAAGNGPDRATFEHVMPRSRGGANLESNLVMCCSNCNIRRGSAILPQHKEVFAMPGMKALLLATAAGRAAQPARST